MLPVQAIAATIMLGMAGLAGAMISMIFSARALSVSCIYQPISSENLVKGGKVDDGMLDTLIKMSDHTRYVMLIRSCFIALYSREQDMARIGARVHMAQLSLLSGLVLAGAGAMVALSLFVLPFLPM